MARPPIQLTESLVEQIHGAVRVGASLKDAAYYSGISYKTLQRWLKQGKTAKSGLYYELYQSVENARAHLIVFLLSKIHSAANTNWKAAAWKLEHLFPQEFGRPTAKTFGAQQKEQSSAS